MSIKTTDCNALCCTHETETFWKPRACRMILRGDGAFTSKSWTIENSALHLKKLLKMSDERSRKALERQRRQAMKEKQLIQLTLDQFDANNCPAYQLLCEKFKEPKRKNLSIGIINPIAELFSHQIGVPIPREARRKRAMLIKWLNDHLDELRLFLPRVRAEFSGGEFV